MNSFGWVDFSKRDRDLARDIIASLSTPGALDELGIGVIRDGFADYFFPGTSTVQTIPKYFFLVAYQLDELSRNPTGNLEQELRKKERECSRKMWDSLTPEEQNSRDTGIFGSTLFKTQDSSSREWVKRQPSSVYWNGLRKIGFLRFGNENQNLSLADYLRFCKQSNQTIVEFDDDSNASSNRYSNSNRPWHWDRFPEDRGDWDKFPTPKLTPGEARFLVEHISENPDNSIYNTLFAFLIRNRDEIELDKMSFAKLGDKLSGQLKADWKLANDFSEFIEPAQICFNVLLHNTEAENEWAEYQKNPEKLKTLADKVDLDRIFNFSGFSVPGKTQTFLSNLWNVYAVWDEDKLKKLLTDREKALKQARAKIGGKDDYHDRWVGGRGFEYRFSDARRIIKDILIAEGKML